MEAQKGSVPSIKKRAAAGFRFVRVAAVDAHIDVLADEALQRSAPGRSGVNVKVLAAVRIRAGWNKPLLRPDKIDSWVLIGRRRETQVIQLHERIAFKGKLDALEPTNFTTKFALGHAGWPSSLEETCDRRTQRMPVSHSHSTLVIFPLTTSTSNGPQPRIPILRLAEIV